MKLVQLLGMASLMGIALLSCGRQNPLQPDANPRPGIMFSEEKLVLPEGEYIYRQNITCDTPAEQYAYRLTTLSGAAPAGWITDAGGWLLWRVPGANAQLPLSQPGDHRSIWTSNSSIRVDNPSAAGKISDLVKQVEIKHRDARGRINTLSSPFRTQRLISSSIGVPFSNGATTGSGTDFGLQEVIGDIFVDGMYAHHFMYRLNILNAALEVIQAGDWHSSLDRPDIRRVLLNAGTIPALLPNNDGEFTQFESYVVSRQGIEEATPKSVYFHAEGGFEPGTFLHAMAALGEHHYGVDSFNYPNSHAFIPNQGIRSNSVLWNVENIPSAINSSDLQIYFQWGFHGQYGAWGMGGYYITDNPLDIELNTIVNQYGNVYYTTITHYDLRLDGAPFPALSQFLAATQITDPNGDIWLRVPNLGFAARHCILSGLSDGIHTLQARSVDAQGVVDSSPSTRTIRLYPYVPPSQRSGILLVDDTAHNSTTAPENAINTFYANVTPDTWGPVTRVDIASSTPQTLTPIQMQNHRAILWHADNHTATNLQNNVDGLEIYLKNDGKLLLSSTSRLVQALDSMWRGAPEFCSQRLGLTEPGVVQILSSSYLTRPFFVSALGVSGRPDIHLNLENPFNTMLTLRQGLGPVAYFEPGWGLDYIYSFGCKATDAPYPPTQEQYDQYSSKYVGYKYISGNSGVILLGFPLSYMLQSDVSSALPLMLAELINPGRKP